MFLVLLLSCTAKLNVVASAPGVEIGVVRSDSQPSVEAPMAEISGVGEIHTRVRYSILETWWVWARRPGEEASVQRYPTQVAVGPAVGCFFLAVPCFWVSKPVSRPVQVEVPEPEPQDLVLADGCSKDTDCKGDRICDRGTCSAP